MFPRSSLLQDCVENYQSIESKSSDNADNSETKTVNEDISNINITPSAFEASPNAGKISSTQK